jgi:hypothetical protein
MKKNAKSDKPFILNAHVKESVEGICGTNE